PEKLDINDLSNPATKILQDLLYLRQPFVELGKKLLEDRLKTLQAEEAATDLAIFNAEIEMVKQAKRGEVTTNIEGVSTEDLNMNDMASLALMIKSAADQAEREGRKFVPYIYLAGTKYYELRDHLIDLGIEWVMQGTGDQHISYQQVLSQPGKFLPFFISFVPESVEDFVRGNPGIGFAKGYLDNISPNIIRHYFAEASYQALLDQGGVGVFVTLQDTEDAPNVIETAFKVALGLTEDPLSALISA
ncbi:hypothetical protein ACFL3D_06925, partial [Candidatus Omnitrophota bacterium]